jgi:asparagine synthase (glutamine-hydrolysing)
VNGFIVILSNDGSQLPDSFSWKPLFSFQQDHCSQLYKESEIAAGKFTPDRFHHHTFFEKSEAGLLVTVGLITNIETLYKKYNCKTAGTLIHQLINKGLLQELHGNFAGIWYDSKEQELTAFNNQTGTQKLYYYKNEHYTAIATDLKVLATTLRSLGAVLSPDSDAVQMLLSYGFMLQDYTLISEIRQVNAGELLKAGKNSLQIGKYYDLSTIERKTLSKEQFIEQLEHTFQQAVHEEYILDEIYGYRSIATLSGGLDSRMTAIVAHKAGHQQDLINFSQKGYADEVIAKQIAHHYQLRLSTVELSAHSLTAIDDVVRVNDGLTLYSGASHVLHAFRQLRQVNSGIIHTGMLGDAIMGSYLSSPCETPPVRGSGAYAKKVSGSSELLFNSIVARYRSDEIFKFYNRAFQGINTGYQYLYLMGESLSPFMHPDFIQLSISIPREYMYKERLYIDWIRKKHPHEASYCWENIGGKPTNNEVLRRFYRIRRAMIKRLPFASMWKNSMTPEQYWYENTEEVRQKLDKYYREHSSHPLIDNNLQLQLSTLYTQGDFTSKSQVLTVVAAFKSLFP